MLLKLGLGIDGISNGEALASLLLLADSASFLLLADGTSNLGRP